MVSDTRGHINCPGAPEEVESCSCPADPAPEAGHSNSPLGPNLLKSVSATGRIQNSHVGGDFRDCLFHRVLQWSEASLPAGDTAGTESPHHCGPGPRPQTSICCSLLSSGPGAEFPVGAASQTSMHLKGPFCSSYLLPHRLCTWASHGYLLHLHLSQGRKVGGTRHWCEFSLFKPRVKPDSGLFSAQQTCLGCTYLAVIYAPAIHTTNLHFQQILLSFMRRLCAHWVIPHKFPLRDPWRPSQQLWRLLAFHGDVTQGVGAPSEALLGWEQGWLLRGLALRVTGQVVRGAQEPEAALRDGQGLFFTARRLLVADRDSRSDTSHGTGGIYKSLIPVAGKHFNM